jgi:type II secretory pathway component PulF
MEKLIRSKKGFTVQDMLPLAIILVVVAIGIGLGAQVLGSIRDDQTSGTYEYNASTNGLDGLDTFSEYIPTIALVVVAAIVIGVLVTYLARRLA